MVGPIQSYPNVISDKKSDYLACYWFDKLPVNLDRVKAFNSELFTKMVRYFESRGEKHRVFIRKTLVGFGGTGSLGSYVLEYYDTVKDETDDSLITLFTHEMVHKFPQIDEEEDDLR